MAERFLVSLDLQNLPNEKESKNILCLNRLHITATNANFTQVCRVLIGDLKRYVVSCDCVALDSLEHIVSILNNGARKVFVTFPQMMAIVEARLLAKQELGRLIISFDYSNSKSDPEVAAESILSKIRPFIPDHLGGIQVHGLHDWKLLDAMRQTSKTEHLPRVYISLTSNIRENYIKAVKDCHVAIIPANELTTDTKQHPHLLPAHLLITSVMTSDRPDGLLPTLVTDERGICLGLVYSNEESIEVALQLGRGVYHSRRHGLWFKGKESGDTQELISIAVDCDSDALQFNVRQNGAGKYLQ